MKKSMVFASMILLSVSAVAQAATIKNWAAPSTWTPPAAHAAGGRTALTTGYPALPFIPLTPCRLIDTRAGSGFPAGYGPPSMAGGGTQRTFVITGRCGVPAGAQAVSFNFAVWGPPTRGGMRVFPAGLATPTVSTLNWEAGILALANAAVVPIGAGGGITVQIDGAGTVDIFADVNGYYSDLAPSGQTFYINNSSGITGIYGIGGLAGTVGVSTSGYGLYGQSSSGIGTYGGSSSNIGVKGLSGSYNGVWAESTTLDGLLASGGRDGAFITGARYGAIVVTSSTTTDQAGVLGKDGAGAGSPSSFYSAGVRGEGRNGVVGISNTLGGYGVGGRADSPATYGVFAIGQLGATGAKPFVEPHPTDPAMVIRYVALEGPEAGTYFRGTAQTVNREAVIQVPDSFRIVSAEEGLTVQLTPVGELAQMAVMSQDLNQIIVQSSRDVTFHYHVNGIRRAFKDWQVVAAGNEFRPVSPDQKMPLAYTEEAKSRLIANGTFNADGTVNMNTAERLGWAQKWREEAAAQAQQKAAQLAKAAQAAPQSSPRSMVP